MRLARSLLGFLSLVVVGGSRRLIISPALGFGPDPRRDQDGQIVIPGNSTVVYDIEVVQVAQ